MTDWKGGEGIMQQLSISQQFAHQPMLHWDRPGTSQHEARASGNAVIRFGRVCVLSRARRLLVDGQPIELGSRAFDLLMVLIGAPGTLVTKDEILSRVWPDTIVAEDNLKVQMSALRKVLNEDREVIKTIHGRGYVFTGELTTTSAEADAFPSRGAESASPQLGPAFVLDDEQQPTIVVIDDDPDIREALRGLLRSVGLAVASFASVQEFLDRPHPELPACLVLDVRLPGLSGLDFQAELGRANLRLPIIFISGYADVPMSVRAMKSGAVEFLTKPFRNQDLLDAIQLAIAQNPARRDRPNR
ncbi:MAG TPA: response regulator [Stellaceae bacterium]|nr:response regulator [Stellaceae bacterium]